MLAISEIMSPDLIEAMMKTTAEATNSSQPAKLQRHAVRSLIVPLSSISRGCSLFHSGLRSRGLTDRRPLRPLGCRSRIPFLPSHHHDGYPHLARGLDLGVGAFAAGIAADDVSDGVAGEQGLFCREVARLAEDQFMVGQR